MNKIIAPPLIAEDSVPLVGFDLEVQLRLHPYDPARLQPTYDILDKQVVDFDPLPEKDEVHLPFGGRVVQSYGSYLADHLEWTSRTLGEFLYHQGYDENIVDKVVQAFKRHDVGKTLQPGTWKITEGKQDLTDDQKAERALHGIYGANLIQTTFQKTLKDPTQGEIMGITIAKHLALFHHERLNGSGPLKRTAAEMCPILRAATIVDTFHGKLKAGKTADQIFEEMVGPKHIGEFDTAMLEQFKGFYAKLHIANKADMAFQL